MRLSNTARVPPRSSGGDGEGPRQRVDDPRFAMNEVVPCKAEDSPAGGHELVVPLPILRAVEVTDVADPSVDLDHQMGGAIQEVDPAHPPLGAQVDLCARERKSETANGFTM